MSKKIVREKLKLTFIGYRRMTAHIETELALCGISVVRHRNHVVLKVPSGENFCSVSVSSTAGDKREGLNIVTKIMRYWNV